MTTPEEELENLFNVVMLYLLQYHYRDNAPGKPGWDTDSAKAAHKALCTLKWRLGKACGDMKERGPMVTVTKATMQALMNRCPDGFVCVREDVVEYLRGAGPLEGTWFGMAPPGKDIRPFWWRKFLPRKAAAPGGEK